MKISATTIKISEIIEKLNLKQYKLPKFQRDFTWSTEKTLALKKSIDKGHPIGAITLYKKGEVSLIIDGQQRLSSILLIHNNKNKEKKDQIPQIEDNYEFPEKYIIPILTWESVDNEKLNIAEFFVDMNDNGSPLDSDDITLTMLSEVLLDVPDWWKREQTKLINKMYSYRNQHISAEGSDTEQISVLEFIWVFIDKIEAFNKNHDINVMAYLSHKTKHEKVKYKLVWMIRILVLLMADMIENMNYRNKPKKFSDNIKIFLNKILIDEFYFNNLAEKLDTTFKLIQKKFSFIIDIPTSKSASKRKGNINNILSKTYIPIYILNFIFHHKNLYKSESNMSKLKNKLEQYKIKGVDVINFMSKEPISSGGYYKWLTYIIEEPEKLFYKPSPQARESLINNIFEKTISSNKNFNKLTKVVIMWLASNTNMVESGNPKNEYYEFDHIIPKTYCRESNIKNYSSIWNSDILSHKENRDKSSELTSKYIDKSFINKKFNFESKDIKDKIDKWSNNNKINLDELNLFISQRNEFIKKSINDQINEEIKQ